MGLPLPGLIVGFAGTGFAGISIAPRMLLDAPDSERRDVVAALAQSGLVVALHGSFDPPIDRLAALAKELAPHLKSITFDPLLGWTSAGLLFRARQMSAYLHELESRTHGLGFWYGVEDFPETPFCLEMYRDDLSSVLDSDRFGILIDIGHFNLSANKYRYYRGVKPEEHFAQLPVQLLEVHLSDNSGQEDEHLPLGIGNIDFASAARGLRRIGFDGLSTIEIEPLNEHDAVDSAKEQVVESLVLWRRLLEEQGSQPSHARSK